MSIDLIRTLVGEVPNGYEQLEYMAALCISLIVIKTIIEMFYFVFSLLKGLK
jgi:divalent metal cation (Fe/Co/Zn/Cd) transporter